MDLTREKEMKARLKACRTFPEMLHVYGEYYDITKKLGGIAKGLIINSLPKIRTVAGFKERLKWERVEEE